MNRMALFIIFIIHCFFFSIICGTGKTIQRTVRQASKPETVSQGNQ
ncbi:Uncharacterised protein [Legionella pneumophila]|nr:Uncharacterised protein [Legionella pneumophila]